jgi:hypothetical protein
VTLDNVEVRRAKREMAAAAFEAALAEKASELADALIAEAIQNPLGHANRVPAIREANLRLLGRPETTGTVAGDPDKPIRIVVESISSRRREQLADVGAHAAEVEELPPALHSSSRDGRVRAPQAGGRSGGGAGAFGF